MLGYDIRSFLNEKELIYSPRASVIEPSLCPPMGTMTTSRDSPRGNSLTVPTISEVRQKTIEKFGRRPCLWQCEVAIAILKGEQDIVCISATGSGKTLTFWMPLLFRETGIQVIITPLNILGTQNKKQLAGFGIEAITISGQTASREKFKVRIVPFYHLSSNTYYTDRTHQRRQHR